jgi:lambda repressor-like predicted transcriptional regulator
MVKLHAPNVITHLNEVRNMKPQDTKAAIARAGTSQAAIAEHLGVSPHSISRVINGTMRSKRIEAELQKITGKPLHPTPSVRGRRKTVWTGQVGAVA